MIDSKPFWQPDYGKYYVTDVETTVNAPPGYKFAADPRYMKNTVVIGCSYQPGLPVHYFYQDDLNTHTRHANDSTIVVGHNLKFDMQYCGVVPAICWDTAIAHHILSGHKAKMPSLEEVAAHYGLGTKTVPMSELWDVGFETEDMDPEFLKEYVTGDVMLTNDVYQKQLEATAKTPMTRLLIVHCSIASLALGRAEMTGIPLDVKALTKLHDEETYHANKLHKDCQKFVEDKYSLPPGTEFPLTPKNLGHVLYNLPITIETQEAAPRILKSGKVAKRCRTIKTEYRCGVPVPSVIPKTSTGSIMVNDDVLQIHADAGSPIAKAMREIRSSEKLISTYTGPAIVYMRGTGFECLHTKFNQTVTNTGRTSSTGPNVQNLPPEIEACIRAPKGKYLLKADFAQLQMCGIAMLSGDPQLIFDINNDVDIHYETGKTVYGWKSPSEMEKGTRRKVKNVNFGLIFHGSPGGLSAQTGVDVVTVNKIIKAFKARYPVAYQYGIDLHEAAKASARPAEGAFIDGVQQNEAFTMTPSGRLIRFVERAAPAWLVAKTKRPLSFSPNEVANYPVQGYSDGDLAIQFLAFMFWNGIQIINLVHDSYWFLTDDWEGLSIEVQALLEEFNITLGLKVPLKLDFVVEDWNGNKVR